MFIFQRNRLCVDACPSISKMMQILLKRFGLLISLFLLGTAVSAAPTTANWAFPDRSYRMPVTVQANGYARA
ncbi:MAG: hypothetical protein KC421_16355, partial [Anaerolineales bacterium]|nr:hypothetical protein [Anaerolineales bacterium]